MKMRIPQKSTEVPANTPSISISSLLYLATWRCSSSLYQIDAQQKAIEVTKFYNGLLFTERLICSPICMAWHCQSLKWSESKFAWQHGLLKIRGLCIHKDRVSIAIDLMEPASHLLDFEKTSSPAQTLRFWPHQAAAPGSLP